MVYCTYDSDRDCQHRSDLWYKSAAHSCIGSTVTVELQSYRGDSVKVPVRQQQ